MLKRKIYDDLVAWKQRSGGTTALLIDGARRVGKSFIAKEFAENEYKSHIIIDFKMEIYHTLELYGLSAGKRFTIFQSCYRKNI